MICLDEVAAAALSSLRRRFFVLRTENEFIRSASAHPRHPPEPSQVAAEMTVGGRPV